MNDQVLGALIELVGATICIIGLNLQRWAALSIMKLQEEGRDVSGCGAKCGGWRWLLAMTVFMGGQIVQTVAYAFGTQTLVSAVSNVSLVVNVKFDDPVSLEEMPGLMTLLEKYGSSGAHVLAFPTDQGWFEPYENNALRLNFKSTYDFGQYPTAVVFDKVRARAAHAHTHTHARTTLLH